MRKRDELIKGCMAKALPDEMTFVLLARDPAAPAAIREWVRCRIELGKNRRDDDHILEALQCAQTMERERDLIKLRLVLPPYDKAPCEIERLRALEAKVQQILRQQGDDHCHLDWGTLYREMATLTGMPDWRPTILPVEAMDRNCQHFVRCLAKGEAYVAPVITEQQADELRAENQRLRDRAALLERMLAVIDQPGRWEGHNGMRD